MISFINKAASAPLVHSYVRGGLAAHKITAAAATQSTCVYVCVIAGWLINSGDETRCAPGRCRRTVYVCALVLLALQELDSQTGFRSRFQLRDTKVNNPPPIFCKNSFPPRINKTAVRGLSRAFFTPLRVAAGFPSC